MEKTIEFWIKPNESECIIIKKGNNEIRQDAFRHIEIFLDGLCGFSLNQLSINEWNQIIFINKLESLYIYINAKYSNKMFPNLLKHFDYFSDIDPGDVKFSGIFGSFVVYERVLTEEEIKSLYSSGIERYREIPIEKSIDKVINKNELDKLDLDDCEMDEINELYIMYLRIYAAIRIAKFDNRDESIHIGLEETLDILECCAKEDFDKIVGMSVFAIACNDEKIMSYNLFCKVITELKKEL